VVKSQKNTRLQSLKRLCNFLIISIQFYRARFAEPSGFLQGCSAVAAQRGYAVLTLQLLKRPSLPFLALGFLSGTIALLLQFYIAFTAPNAIWWFTAIKLTTFFTIDSNLLLWTFYGSLLFFKDKKIGYFFAGKGISTALLIYITVVCIVYHLLLQDVWNPQGLQWWVGELLHWAYPLIFLLYWLIFVSKSDLSFRQIPAWLLFPTGYFFYVMLLGFIGFRYPYPFLDLAKMGIVKIFITGFVLLLAIAFIAVAYVLLAKAIASLKKRIGLSF